MPNITIKHLLSFIIIVISFYKLNAQDSKIKGKITDTDGVPVPYASVVVTATKKGTIADSSGYYTLSLHHGHHTLEVSSLGYISKKTSVHLSSGQELTVDFTLIPEVQSAPEINVKDKKNTNASGIDRMKDVDSTAIYAGKKNEVITLDKMNLNNATNNTRQLFSKVPGINIIEDDASGIQMSVATRGLNPNRITQFNTRQNGYDISADPIGYPESYYTPTTDALSKIEVVRGAASLQYGSQFGGLLNFVFKKPPNKPYEVVSKQTAGSYGFFNSFNSIGGTYKKFSYYCFFNHKQGNGWRQNTGFNINSGFFSINYAVNSKLTISAEFTKMNYNARQPGGLTDAMFAADPRQSVRNRNWFSAGWNLPAIIINYKLDSNTRINIRNYGLIAYRRTIGNLNSVNLPQPDTGYRLLMYDNYLNIASETRLIHSYKLFNTIKSTGVIGFRYFGGHTRRRQGNGSAGSDADYTFNKPNDQLEGMNFYMPSTNIALFAENTFNITKRFSITPGIRYEYIRTTARGYYVSNSIVNENNSHPRHFTLLGLGLQYKLSETTNMYANWSQNYSPVNYSDIYVVSPDFKVDPNLKDVRGYNGDIGIRGNINNTLNFDIGGYVMYYDNRIGQIEEADNNGNIYTYQTNVANSRTLGIESFTEFDFFRLFKIDKLLGNLSAYATVAYTNALYYKSPYLSVIDKSVEYVPEWINRYGCTYRYKKFSTSLQYSHVSMQYTDATNSISSADGVTGIIPAYHVVDCSANYSYKFLILGISANNLTNQMYFTRRTSGMPGPGIIPSSGRTFYLTIGLKI